jgi:hypothetical protein
MLATPLSHANLTALCRQGWILVAFPHKSPILSTNCVNFVRISGNRRIVVGFVFFNLKGLPSLSFAYIGPKNADFRRLQSI